MDEAFPSICSWIHGGILFIARNEGGFSINSTPIFFFVDTSAEKRCHINKQTGTTEFWHSNATRFFSLFANYVAHTKNRTVTRHRTLVLTINQLTTQFNSCSPVILLEVKTWKPPGLHRTCHLVLKRFLSQFLYPYFQLSLCLGPWRFSRGSPRSTLL